jgi:hypothetical protein
MTEPLKYIATVLAMYLTVSLGMLYAFCPINDKETSTIHRVVTLLVFSLVLAVVLVEVWK